LLLSLVTTASAQKSHHLPHIKLVGHDAEDTWYYSIAWAKAHGMHDKGGDPLTIVPLSSLPGEAKMSKAMHSRTQPIETHDQEATLHRASLFTLF
jgi:hypothetical protein